MLNQSTHYLIALRRQGKPIQPCAMKMDKRARVEHADHLTHAKIGAHVVKVHHRATTIIKIIAEEIVETAGICRKGKSEQKQGKN